MAGQTHIDEIIDCTEAIRTAIINSKDVMQFVADNPNLDMESVEADEAARCVYGYDFIDETQQLSQAMIMVDTDVIEQSRHAMRGSMMDIAVYIQVVVDKKFMNLDTKRFKGVRGNRRDNIIRQIDLLVRGLKDFGVGELSIVSCVTANVPVRFTSKMLTYAVPAYNKDRSKLR